MKKTFKEIVKEEKIVIPTSLEVAKRLQRFSPSRSVDFDLDKESLDLLKDIFPLRCTFTLTKKVAENILIASREKHRKTDITRLSLMQLPTYHGYRNDSFYYSKE
jgi:hypothetical protein